MTSVEMPRASDRETEEAGLQAEAAEREAFEARFPPETFSRIVEAMGLAPEPEILSGLRRSLLETFYFFYAISSGDRLSREEQISGLTELRDAARSLSKSLRYRGAWITVGSLGKAEHEPLYDEKFRATVRDEGGEENRRAEISTRSAGQAEKGGFLGANARSRPNIRGLD